MPIATDPVMTKPIEYATYTTIRIDTDIYFLAKGAAALSGYRTLSEYISDKLNVVCSTDLLREPLKRKPPPPKPKGKGRPRKPKP